MDIGKGINVRYKSNAVQWKYEHYCNLKSSTDFIIVG